MITPSSTAQLRLAVPVALPNGATRRLALIDAGGWRLPGPPHSRLEIWLRLTKSRSTVQRVPNVPSVSTRVPETPELLTTAEAAAVLRVDRKTLRRWGRTGRLDEVCLNARTFRYPAASIAALMTPMAITDPDSEPL